MVEENTDSHCFGVSSPHSPTAAQTKHHHTDVSPHPCVHLLQIYKESNPFPEQQITIPSATPCKQRGRKGPSVKCSLMCSN